MASAPSKKQRTGSSPPRNLDLPTASTAPLSASALKAARDGVSSPLFFSTGPPRHHSRLSIDSHHASSLGSALGSPVAILSRTREDSSNVVTTVKLPSASVRTASPGFSTGTPASLASSIEAGTSVTSPDSRPLPPSLQMLRGVGILELLDHDSRPTFLVDLGTAGDSARSVPIVYGNSALRASQHHLYPCLTLASDDAAEVHDFEQFASWILHPVQDADESPFAAPSWDYRGISWTKLTVRQKCRFVSANIHAKPDQSVLASGVSITPLSLGEELTSPFVSTGNSPAPVADQQSTTDYFGDVTMQETETRDQSLNDAAIAATKSSTIAPDSDEHGPCQHPDEFTHQVLQYQPVRSFFDWTRIPMSDELPDHIKFAKSFDWASTPLGPIEDWPTELRVTSNLVMGSPHPAAMYWGEDYVVIYNEAYIELAGRKHPHLMGKKYKDAWPEIFPTIEPVLKSAWEQGQATMKRDDCLFIHRNGYLEEGFFSWSIVPLIGAHGEVVGLYNAAFENTRRQIGERRMLTLRAIGESVSTASTVSDFWQLAQKGLQYNELDVPFSLIYSVVDELTQSDVSSAHSALSAPPLQLTLESSSGVPEDHPSAPRLLDLRSSDDGFAPYMKQSIAMGGCDIVLSKDDETLPPHLVEGFQWGGFGDACKTVVVHPITPTSGDAPTAFIVLGVNPRRPYDDEYRLFIHLLARQLGTSLASVLLFEEEIKRGQHAARLAALDRQELSMQLLLRTQEASESEYRFTRMAEFAPVGMFIADALGTVIYCNDMWSRISGHSRNQDIVSAWMDSVRDEDRGRLESEWASLLKDKETISVEFRFNSRQRKDETTIDTWVLMSAYPEKNSDGSLASIFGCITDISSQKWAEKVQDERRQEAVELKRQQENFIDITSHEMRNPLTAILQCADQIVNNTAAFTSYGVQKEVETLVESCLDAANTINLCASHQKRIVDDILTLSKLDSNLLTVTPIDDQPVKAVQQTLKMFQSELLAHDIEFEFILDGSFEALDIKWAKFDPSRLGQVLINLMTNAIKFTQGRENRNITVRLGASLDVSDYATRGTQYLRRHNDQRSTSTDMNNDELWGDGGIFNLHCSVEDTGRGLSEEELKILFQRFQQATPRTHVQYGGSGLGLFISRILTEMQGGQISVTSCKDQGSKFNFYIQCRRCENPPAEFVPVSAFKITRREAPLTQQLSAPSDVLPASQPMSDLDMGMGDQPQRYDVLIVEDNIVNQKVLQRQLRSCGNNIYVANHGEEALQTLQRSRFWTGQEETGLDVSVILMDLEMPIMDGMTCTRRIRELERQGVITKHIPIIAVTAYARPEQIADAKAAGIVSCP